MKKTIIILLVFIFLLTGCNDEDNGKNNSSMVSAPLSQTQLTIRKLLDYVITNQFDIFYNDSFKKKYDENFKIAFQNVYGDEQPELILCVEDQYYSDGEYLPEDIVLIFSVENDAVIYLDHYSNFFKNDKYHKFSLKKNNGEFYIVSNRIDKFEYNELYNDEQKNRYNKNALVENDYAELTCIGIDKISSPSKNSFPGDIYGFQTIKATCQPIFFHEACGVVFYDKVAHLYEPWRAEGENLPKYDEKPLSEYFIEECKPYKYADTGLYELYTVEAAIVNKKWGKKDYPLNFQTMGYFDTMVLPKADYEKLYAEYMSDFQDYSSPVYLSDVMTIEKFDLDKIEKEAMMVFETKAS